MQETLNEERDRKNREKDTIAIKITLTTCLVDLYDN